MTEVFLTIVGAIMISYLGGCFLAQKKAIKKRNQEIIIANEAYIKAKAETKKAKDEIILAITKYYGPEDANKVSKNEIWIGMESILIIASWGEAVDIKTSFNTGKRIERWYYNPHYNRLNNLKYKTELTLENNHLIGWKDLS